MLQTSDGYTVNRDTLTIRGVITSDQGQYWCRGQIRSVSSQSNSVSLSVKDSSSSLLVTAVVVGSSVFLLIFISLLLLWRYKKNKDQQRNINQTSVPNQSAEPQPENFPLQSADSYQICDVVTEVKKRDKGDPEPLADVTYSEITVKKHKKKMNKGKSSESGDTLYSELKHNTDRDADAGDETCAQPLRKKNKTHKNYVSECSEDNRRLKEIHSSRHSDACIASEMNLSELLTHLFSTHLDSSCLSSVLKTRLLDDVLRPESSSQSQQNEPHFSCRVQLKTELK
ncbi:uncharacterized protein LOC132128327 [Carassius carassius]|uniref:uncharacterized protein LOC132128327 n=1 Tax=Carassius carassius TaxID=217509 RepID=UPI00286887E5|nr:uncharacterized protein LOC132128327 [Carassius carassius]